MKTITARDAEHHFGELLDTMQREPVVITQDNRPVGILISMEDAANSLIADHFIEKEPGYDAWLADKVGSAQEALQSGTTSTDEHEAVMKRVWSRLHPGQ
jgi:prevent-host-death family protein